MRWESNVLLVKVILILDVWILLRVWDQGESVFRLRKVNIVGFYDLFVIYVCLKMVVWPKHVAQLNK
jgi:hypothetical protein